MENKNSKLYPHLYEYQRRCRLISESDEEYYNKYYNEISEQAKLEEIHWITRLVVLGGSKTIHGDQ